MKPEYNARLEALIKEEVELLKQQGATEADIHEPALLELVTRRVLERHFEQMYDDPVLMRAIAEYVLDEAASPQQLRELAAKAGERGQADLAYDLETLADSVKRQGR